MTFRQTAPLLFLAVVLLLQACANGTSSNAQTPAKPEAEKTMEPEAIKTPAATEEKAPEDAKPGRIGTIPTGKDAELTRTKPQPIAAPQKSTPAEGPTAYINKAGVTLQNEPAKNSPRNRNFEVYEQVIILETKMTDDDGNPVNFPKWYKVKCADKKEGWVVASSVTIN